jgi:hypothetical protein
MIHPISSIPIQSSPQTDPRVYAAGAIPDHVVSMATGRRLAVGAVAAHALKLRWV